MPRQLPPLNALVAVEATLRHQSVRRAADELHVTPAAVSQHLRHLEEHYGVALVARRARGIALTDAGRRILPGLREALDRLERATAPLSARNRVTRVRLSLLPGLATGWLLPLLPEFQSAFPELELTLLTSSRIVDFSKDEVDLALRYCVAPSPDLASIRLFGEDVFPVASPRLLPGGPVPLARLRNLPLLHDVDAEPSQPVLGWAHWLETDSESSPLPSGLRFSDSSVLMDAAVRGLGIALGRGPLVEPYLREGQLVQAASERRRSNRAYFLVGPKAHFRRTGLRPVIDWLRAAAEENVRRSEDHSAARGA